MTTSGDVGTEIVPEVADHPQLAARLGGLQPWGEPSPTLSKLRSVSTSTVTEMRRASSSPERAVRALAPSGPLEARSRLIGRSQG